MKISYEHVNGVDIITITRWFGLVSERYVHLTVPNWIKRENFDLVNYLTNVETGQDISGYSGGIWSDGDAMYVYDFLQEYKKKTCDSEKAKKAQDLIDPKHREPTPAKAPPPRGK